MTDKQAKEIIERLEERSFQAQQYADAFGVYVSGFTIDSPVSLSYRSAIEIVKEVMGGEQIA
jgi:hypothetical protein